MNEFKKYLKEKKVNQKWLAKELGITYGSLRHKVNGDTDFKVSEMKQIVKTLRLTPKEVLDLFFVDSIEVSTFDSK